MRQTDCLWESSLLEVSDEKVILKKSDYLIHAMSLNSSFQRIAWLALPQEFSQPAG